jgi:hypothetical protein
MKRFIALLVAIGVMVVTIGISANFTKTYVVPTRRDYIKNDRQEIAELSYDFDALIAHYNALRTSVTYGTIDLPLTGWREVDATGDVGDATADGGILRSDTTPFLEAITGVTKKAQQVNWVASNNDPIMYQFSLPYDFKTSSDVIVDLRVASDGTTDAVAFHVYYFIDEDDATGDATGDTQTSTSYGSIEYTIPASDITIDTTGMTLILVPLAHTTDKVYLSRARLKYIRNF